MSTEDLEAFKKAVESDPDFKHHDTAKRLVLALLQLYVESGPVAALGPRAAWERIRTNEKAGISNVYVQKKTASDVLARFERRYSLPFTARIADGDYRLEFTRVTPSAQSVRLFDALWAPYLQFPRNPVVVFTSPLFFREAGGTYVRNIHANEESQRERLSSVVREEVLPGLVPSLHYFSAGEVNGVLRLMATFAERGKCLDYSVVGSNDPAKQYDQRPVVSIGSGRTNWQVSLPREGSPYVAAATRVEVYDVDNAAGSDKPPFVRAYEDHEEHGVLVLYAVFTRCRGIHEHLAYTTIGANNGRAAQGAIQLATDENALGALAAPLKGNLTEPFQAIIRVDVARHPAESEVTAISLVEVWSRATRRVILRRER